MLSSAGCAVCMFIIAGCLLVKSYSTAAAATAFMFLYVDGKEHLPNMTVS